MKPLKLVMQAFGPYPNREEIDFNDLALAGIFLIKGPTGSGKTTIFDAMLMALYGKSTVEDDKSKTGRNKLEVWRCNQAKDGDETIVEFTFEADGKVYRFTRKLIPKRVRLEQVNAVCVMDENGIFQVVDENPKDGIVNEKAEKLIGLTCNQFRQVVLLPQGQFERFLTADSSEKEQILSKLFNASQWETYAQKMFEKAEDRERELLREKNRVVTSLDDEKKDLVSIADLWGYIGKLKLDLESIEKEHEEYNIVEKRKKLEEEKQLYSKYETLHKIEERKKALEGQAKSVDELRKKLEMAEKAETVRTLLGEVDKYQKDFYEQKESLSELKKLTEEIIEKLNSSKEALNAHKSDKTAESCNEQKIVLEGKRQVYEVVDGLVSAAFEADEAYKSAEGEHTRQEELLNEAKNEARKKLKQRDEADDKAHIYRDRYYAGIYGEIANQLEENKPCPVCGSTSHPAPAVSKESVSKADMEQAEKDAETAKQDWETADKKREKAFEKAQELGKRLIEAEGRKREAYIQLGNNVKEQVEGIKSTEELEEKLIELSEKINEYNQKMIDLESEFNQADRAYTEHNTKLKEKEELYWKAEKRYLTEKEKLETILKEKGYDSIEEAKSQQMTTEEQKYFTQKLTEFETSLGNISQEFDEALNKVADTIEPDSSLFEEKQNEIEEEHTNFVKRQAELTSEIDRLSKKYEKLTVIWDHYEKNIGEAEYDVNFAKGLRGDTGIGLRRYVLGIMFNQIITEANNMLKLVHGGRYQLFRTNEKGSGNKRGLELLVSDNRKPEEKGRPVMSLSGGEKFLVSLSLSIGMSAIAQKSGLHIEALFIDEGFGTLDDDSISDAMDILECVQKSNGMIGIISHVSVLESAIPKHVEIVKTDRGSSVKMR